MAKTINKKYNYNSVEETPVWKLSYELVLLVYKITSNFPKSEVYGLVSQIRRSACSIGANISEGFDRHTTKELIQFLYNARGSCAETRFHLRVALGLKYVSGEEYTRANDLLGNIGKQLNGWIKSLKNLKN